MKRILTTFIFVLAAGVFCTSCQPTPEVAPVVNKRESAEAFAEAAKSTPAASSAMPSAPIDENELYTLLGAPKNWQEDFPAKATSFELRIDAPVNLPATATLPVATAVRRIFTQDEVNNVGNALLGNDARYTEHVFYTKENIENSIIEEQRFMEEMKAEGDDLFVEKSQNAIDYLKSIYEEAPSAADLRPKGLALSEIDNPYNSNEKTLGVNVTSNKNGELYSYTALNDTDDSFVYIGVSCVNGTGNIDIQKPYGISLTKEQAAQQAISIAKQFSSDMELSHVGIAASGSENTKRNWGWACVFTRSINGCPVTYTVDDVGSNMDSDMQASVRYEMMLIAMDDLGVIDFTWINPLEIISIQNENVDLLPFDKIKDIAKDQLSFKYSDYAYPDGSYIDVNGVQLGLMRVNKPDSVEYYYLPVWDIYSKITDPNTPPICESDLVGENGETIGGLTSGYAPETYNSITINAIDGSIINRNFGY